MKNQSESNLISSNPGPGRAESDSVLSQDQSLLGVVALLKKSWYFWRANFRLLAGVIVPVLILQVLGITFVFFPVILSSTLSFLGSIATVVVSLWTAVALLFAIRDAEQGITAKEALKKGWKRIPAYWWISILLVAISIGGFLLFIIPGIIFWIWFSFAIYVLVDEDKRGMNALFRSKQLVAGYWWKIFGRYITLSLTIVIVIIPVTIIAVGIGLGGFLWEVAQNGFDATGENKIPTLLGGLVQLLMTVFQWFISMFSAVFGFMLYRDLKRVKGNPEFTPPATRTKIKLISVGLFGIIAFVLILVGILVAVVITSFQDSSAKLEDAKRAVNAEVIASQLNLYYEKNGLYPASLEEIQNELPEYLVKEPAAYDYRFLQDGQRYEICVDFEAQADECFNSEGQWIPRLRLIEPLERGV